VCFGVAARGGGRRRRHSPDFKADLVVALAGGAVRHGVGAARDGDIDLLLRDQRPRNRGAQQVDALIQRVGSGKERQELWGAPRKAESSMVTTKKMCSLSMTAIY
jgi:hypothetical protein